MKQFTQMSAARAGILTNEMSAVARDENISAEAVMAGLSDGTIVIPRNRGRALARPVGIGRGLRTKVNALIGTSSERHQMGLEVEKLEAALEAGADAVMDLSTGGDIDAMRRQTLELSPVAVGTVPLYQAAIEAIEEGGSVVGMDVERLFEAIERQAAEGVDFMAVHTGLTAETLVRLKAQGRTADIVSRGGAFLTGWMLHNDRENPLCEYFDRLLEIASRYDVTLSLSDGLRPGCIADSLDRAQLQGLLAVGDQIRRAREAGVQALVEGPGHVPLHQIPATVALQKRICGGAPYFLLGNLVTDSAAGHDHIAAAIGGAAASAAGADFICYVTPAEHLGLPDADDVREGMMAAAIAARAGDLAKGVPSALEKEEGAVPRPHAHGGSPCPVCGEICAYGLVAGYFA